MKFVVKISNSVGQAAWLAAVAGSEFHSVGELELPDVLRPYSSLRRLTRR
jgi:hypothetical protein